MLRKVSGMTEARGFLVAVPSGRSPHMPRSLRWFLVLSVVVVLVATLTPLESQNVGPEAPCVLCGAPSLTDAVLNLGLFLPFGIALGLNRYPTRRILALGGLLSVGVEIAQI